LKSDTFHIAQANMNQRSPSVKYPAHIKTGKLGLGHSVHGPQKRGRSLVNKLFCKVLLVMSCLCGGFAQANGMVIAVWDFDCHDVATPNAPALNTLSRALSEILIEQLLSYPGVQVVERMRLREILDEQKLGSSALADEDARLRLGRVAGAQHMVFGSLISLGDITRDGIRLVSVQTSQVLTSHEASAKTDELGTTMVDVARALATSIGHGKKDTRNDSIPAANPATLVLFDQGLALMDRKDFVAAIDVFKKLLASTAGFMPAERQLQISLEKLTRQ